MNIRLATIRPTAMAKNNFYSSNSDYEFFKERLALFFQDFARNVHFNFEIKSEEYYYDELLISWEDGPTEQQIKIYSKKLKAPNLQIIDAAIDRAVKGGWKMLYLNTRYGEVPRFQFIKFNRTISLKTYEEAFNFVKNLWGMFYKINNVNSSILFEDGTNTTVKKELYKYLKYMDLTNGINYDDLELDYDSFIEKYKKIINGIT